jgi:hypothetical protein
LLTIAQQWMLTYVYGRTQQAWYDRCHNNQPLTGSSKASGGLKQQRCAKTRGRTMSTGRRKDCSEYSDSSKEGELSQSTANMTINKDTINI